MKALIIFVSCMAVPVTWIILKFAPWSMPLPFICGAVAVFFGVQLHSDTVLAFGAGMCVFSTVLFVLGNGMKGR